MISALPIAVFILFLLAISLLKKEKRGITLDSEDKALQYVTLLFGVPLGFLGVAATINPQFFAPFSDLINWALIILMIGVVLLYIRFRGKPTIGNPAFWNTIALYDTNDISKDDYYKFNPKYLANKRTHQIFLTPLDFIDKYIRTQEITNYKTFATNAKLKSELKERGYSFIPKEAKMSDLDVYQCPNGRLLGFENNIIPSMFPTLEKAKQNSAFKDYTVILLYPWRQRTKSSEMGNYPPSNRILIDNRTKIATIPPEDDLWLINDYLNATKRRKHFPYEKVKWWCSIEHYKFILKRCDIYEILDSVENKEKK